MVSYLIEKLLVKEWKEMNKDIKKIASMKGVTYVSVQDGVMTACDGDIMVQVDCDVADGVYNTALVKEGIFKRDEVIDINRMNVLPEVENKHGSILVSYDDLLLLSKTMGNDTYRYYINGALIENEYFATTDGSILQRLTVERGSVGGRHILSAKFIKFLLKLKRKSYVIGVYEGYSTYIDVSVRVTATLIDGNYPDISRIIQDYNGDPAICDFSGLKGQKKIVKSYGQTLSVTKRGKSIPVIPVILNNGQVIINEDDPVIILDKCVESDAFPRMLISFEYLSLLSTGHCGAIMYDSALRFDREDGRLTTIIMSMRG